MSKNNQKIILITGASSGIGKACFEYLTSKGHEVYGTSRRKSDNPKMFILDVTEPKSIEESVSKIIEEHGKIDVLVNNAGVALVGAFEDCSQAEAKELMETNFWGVVNCSHQVLPHMRVKKSGLIINIGSIAGRVAVPYQSFYSASKFALEGLTESMGMELVPHGIKVCLIEPGDFHTEMSKNRKVSHGATDAGSAYRNKFDHAYQIIRDGELQGNNPVKIARLVEKIIAKKNPRVRYAIGKPLEVLAIGVKKILPQKTFEWIIMDHYKI